MNSSGTRFFIKDLIYELLLYSGQFALFYLLMQFIVSGTGVFTNYGHTGLLIVLIMQTLVLARWGKNRSVRIAGSFLVPICYSLFELEEGFAYVFNAAHVGFWIYAALTAALMVAATNKNDKKYSKATEFVLVFINVFIFIFIYFYLDTSKEIANSDELTIDKIPRHVSVFLKDPAHWYVMWGGLFLAITVALGRMEIALLKDKIHALFGQYVDRQVRDMIIEGGKLEAKKSELCVLFSDIRDFTSLSEKYDPVSVTGMLNHYFEQWNTVVKKHNGVVDKYIGDAIMVIFGLTDQQNACNAAVQCGLEMRGSWSALQEKFASENLPVPADFGIGCHYGSLIIGDIGSKDRKNFTVIGDTVNIASRLESANKETDSNILISSEVYGRLAPPLQKKFHMLGSLHLKGKEKSIETWGGKNLM